ncbi:MAG: hypothetical protein K2H50_07865 [Paramuribaculum sp.]|nr:hypothetical protein [Paramuribaculum sp.]
MVGVVHRLAPAELILGGHDIRLFPNSPIIPTMALSGAHSPGTASPLRGSERGGFLPQPALTLGWGFPQTRSYGADIKMDMT